MEQTGDCPLFVLEVLLKYDIVADALDAEAELALLDGGEVVTTL